MGKLLKSYIALGLIVVVFILAILLWPAISMLNKESYVGTVTDKDRIVKSNDSYYLVYVTLDNGETRVFKNEDSLLLMKWNSSDVQGSIEVGNRYLFDVRGYRIPFFSQYENINKAAIKN